MKKFFLVLLFLAFTAAQSFSADSNPLSKPNILFIVADVLGWADVGWHGSKHRTPALDKLVREGVELDQHYVQPVCSPTRTALLSGRWTSRFGPHVLAPTNLRASPPGTVTLASALKSAGYATFLSGKWHLGSRLEWGPNRYGFEHSYGSLTGADPSELFNLAKDPYEKNNLAATETRKRKELEQLLGDLRKNDVTTLPEDLKGAPQ